MSDDPTAKEKTISEKVYDSNKFFLTLSLIAIPIMLSLTGLITSPSEIDSGPAQGDDDAITLGYLLAVGFISLSLVLIVTVPVNAFLLAYEGLTKKQFGDSKPWHKKLLVALGILPQAVFLITAFVLPLTSLIVAMYYAK